MKIKSICTGAMLVLSLAVMARPDWTRYVIFPDGADYTVESRSPESFVIKAKRKDEAVVKTGALAIANVNREMWTHNRFVMNVRSLNGRRVNVGISVSHPDGSGKTVMSSVPGIDVSGSGWRQIVLGLDTDFGLGDRNIKIVQVKIGAWVSDWRSGDEGGIEVKGLRFCGPGEVADSSAWRAGDTFVSVPAKLRPPAVVAEDSLKVYFALDNEDVIPSRHKRKGFFDVRQDAGFRERLLEDLDGKAVVTTNLVSADVIVYSRCSPDSAEAKGIADAVRTRGVPLYVASEVSDPEVEALLPCTIGHEPPEDLPRRERVVRCDGGALAVENDAAFGIYRTIKAHSSAKKHLQFEDGTPALVEGVCGRGRVMYNMLTLGSSLVPGKAARDAFFVRALGYLTGRTLPERARTVAQPSKDGWWAGLGTQEFGRFGWEIGSGLLVEDVGAHLTVRRGDASYDVVVPRAGTKPRKTTFAGIRAEPLSLGGEVSVDGERAFRVDMSLAYPGVRWQIHRSEIEFHLANLNAFAFLPSGRLIDLATVSELDVRELTKPWLLLFNGSDSDAPLLVVLQRRPKRIEVMRQGEAVEGLRFVAGKKSVGVIVPTWIYGSQTVDTTQWAKKGVPKDAMARSAKWYPFAFSYPIRCREKFRIDSVKKRIDVLTQYEYERVKDHWNTPRMNYAALPPLAWNLKGVDAVDGTEIVTVESGAAATGLVTRYGDFAVKMGDDKVEWMLPLFTPDLSLLPHPVGFTNCEAVVNSQFASGVRFTCGGGVKVNYQLDKREHHGSRKATGRGCNLSMHGALLGMCRCTPNPFGYSEENRRLMRRRLVWRMLEPLETMQHKMVCRWRREPVSGVRYTIYMDSPRDISTRYEPEEYGSKIIYGDSNETVRMILMCTQVLEDRMGQHGLVKANWDTFARDVVSYELAIDDWLIMCSGCLEWGGPGSIDMLNSEFACMMTLARLAEIAGDEALRAQALYRASRRMCPTLARLRMLDYYTRHGLVARPETLRAATGFNESGATFQRRQAKVRDIDLFDMSQGIPQDLIALYNWYGWTELRRDYLSVVRSATPQTGLNYITLAALAIGDDLSDAELRAKLDACLADEKLNKNLPKDWPGMDTGSYLDYTLARLSGAPTITDCRGVNLHNAVWDASTHTLTLDVTPGMAASLAVNGKPVSLAGTKRQICRVACMGR